MNVLLNKPVFLGLFSPMSVFVGLVIIVCIYLLLREFKCWYLKTNKILKELEEIKGILVSQNKNKEPQAEKNEL